MDVNTFRVMIPSKEKPDLEIISVEKHTKSEGQYVVTIAFKTKALVSTSRPSESAVVVKSAAAPAAPAASVTPAAPAASASPVTRAPPVTPVTRATPVTPVSTSTESKIRKKQRLSKARMSCRCQKTIAYLQSIGAMHAAAMHQNPEREWAAVDWLSHMKEEEELLLPRLPNEIAHKLFVEHVVYRTEIARYGRIVSDTTRHSDLEDAWVGVLILNTQ